ncbi:glycosyltransferase family 39 protein [Candidatus Gottesmanbacteria bacterium]|nr:glycosyltransferase family 39 protein [Candidatus Gottesmanbacteria bacterium]
MKIFNFIKKNFFFLTLLLFAFILRFYHLDGIPNYLSGDESEIGISARRIINGEVKASIFETGWYSIPNAYFYLISLSLRMFGNTLLGIRFFSALASFLTVIFTYYFGKILFDRQTGFAAGLI